VSFDDGRDIPPLAWLLTEACWRQVGNVLHADVLEDHEGRSKGCGIVEYDNAHAAMRAIRELNNTDLKGRLIFVREDREDKKMMMGGSNSCTCAALMAL
jgi:RNA recognition motif-containing protein